MRKRIIAIFLTLALSAAFLTLPALAKADEATILQVLSIMEIMVGDEKGNLNLGNNVTRAEFAKLAVSASIYKDAATAYSHVSPFPDVRSTHWAAGYIKTAVDAGWITGYIDGTYKPDSTVKLEEAVTVVLKILGYTDSDFQGTYPNGQLSLYRALELNTNISALPGSPLTRRDCANLIYNALIAKTKSQTIYATTLGYSVDINGDLDYLSLLNTKMNGPVIAPSIGTLDAVIGFTPNIVYRNGSASTLDSVAPYDVVYYMENLSAIWVSSAKAHGVYESASPDITSPTSVVVSGKTYAVGSVSARMALSAIGEFAIGDNLTLLLGLDGSISGVISPFTNDQTVFGLVTKSDTRQFTNSDGSTYSSYYVEVATTGGQIFEYATGNDAIGVGKLVSVQFSGSAPVVKTLSVATNKISGRVNADATKLGSHLFSDDVEIMDVYEGTYTVINPSRLRYAEISSDSVLYYRLNGAGDIEKLILKNVTGDMYTYGILTGKTESSASLSSNATYQYINNGVAATHQSSRVYNNVSIGPIFLRYGKNNAVDLVKSLIEIRLTDLSETTATNNAVSYVLTEKVQVYEKVGTNDYLLTSIGHLTNKGLSSYTLTGYMDKPESEGGRMRIIIATERT